MPDHYDDLTRDQLISLLRRRDASRKLGLVWERDEIEHERDLTEDLPLLTLDSELSRGTGPWSNLLIEGDNFHALRFLTKAYRGQVKCLYIDPPYNTGTKDFIYNDRFVGTDDGWRHSKWLEFLYRRLSLARDLLRQDGVLLVSINDENRAYLELLLDEVWPGGRRGTIVWRTRQGSNADQRVFLSSDHEHVLVWSNSEFTFAGYKKSYAMYSNPDNDPRGEWRTGDLTLGFSMDERPNLFYPIQDPKTDIWYAASPNAVWRFASEARLRSGQRVQTETMEEFIRREQILFPVDQRVEVFPDVDALLEAIDSGEVPKSGRNPLLWQEMPNLDFWVGKKIGFGRPQFKRYKADLRNENQPLSSWVVPSFEEGTYEAETSFVSGTNQEGAKVLQRVLGGKVFNYSKPVSLMRGLIEQSTAPGDLVMDFFAGSATTGQAAAELGRRFVLVSSTEATEEDPDKNICRDVAARRLAALDVDFAYLRVERHSGESGGRNLDEAVIWASLQVLTTGSVAKTDLSRSLVIRETADQVMVLVRAVNTETLAGLAAMEVPSGKTGVAYCWQPGPVRQALSQRDHWRVEALPQALVAPLTGGLQ